MRVLRTLRVLMVGIIVSMLCLSGAYACEYMLFPRLEVPEDLVAFRGKIVEFVTLPVEVGEVTSIVGVRIVVEERAAGKTSQEVELYAFGDGIDCEPYPLSREYQMDENPPGSSVWVIGYFLGVETVEPEVRTRLGTAPIEGGLIQLVDGPTPPNEYGHVQNLVRLREAQTEEERVAILSDMQEYVRFHRMRPEHAVKSYRSLLKSSAVPWKKRKALMREFRARVK